MPCKWHNTVNVVDGEWLCVWEQAKYKVEVSIISTGRWMMYCPMMFASHRARANKT